MADEAAETAPAWSPPEQDPTTGIALYQGLPLNHRLRAEALADMGETEDREGLIPAELIADAAERLAADRAAEERNTPSMQWNRDRLVAHAATIPGLVIEGDATKAAILDAINAAPAASTEG